MPESLDVEEVVEQNLLYPDRMRRIARTRTIPSDKLADALLAAVANGKCDLSLAEAVDALSLEVDVVPWD